MKLFSKMGNGRSSSKSRAAAARVSEHVEAEEIITKTPQTPKFASLYEEEEEDDDDEGDYGLIRNPRKPCTIPSSTNGVNHQKKFICEKCGKGFQSSKARCGHMASHSRVSAKQENVMEMDSESDTESSGIQKQRMRLRLRRNKSGADSKAKVDVFNNCSSGVSGIEQEQEQEVAISLMMLSRDSSNWGGFNSVGDSSDNNSVVLEDRSILGIRKSSLISGCDVNVRRSKKVKTLGNFESGYFGNGRENVGSDSKIRKLRENGFGEGSAVEPHLNLSKLEAALDSEGYREIQSPEIDPSLTKSASYESHSSEIHIRFEDKALTDSHLSSNVNAARHKSPKPCEIDAYHNQPNGKGKKHECLVCSRTFRSGQALGSHMRVHSADGSEEVKSDEVAGHFNGTQLLDSFDLNLPAPMDDEEASESKAN